MFSRFYFKSKMRDGILLTLKYLHDDTFLKNSKEFVA